MFEALGNCLPLAHEVFEILIVSILSLFIFIFSKHFLGTTKNFIVQGYMFSHRHMNCSHRLGLYLPKAIPSHNNIATMPALILLK